LTASTHAHACPPTLCLQSDEEEGEDGKPRRGSKKGKDDEGEGEGGEGGGEPKGESKHAGGSDEAPAEKQGEKQEEEAAQPAAEPEPEVVGGAGAGAEPTEATEPTAAAGTD
jgi:hypothetical protein